MTNALSSSSALFDRVTPSRFCDDRYKIAVAGGTKSYKMARDEQFGGAGDGQTEGI
jgi:hypothetical protein